MDRVRESLPLLHVWRSCPIGIALVLVVALSGFVQGAEQPQPHDGTRVDRARAYFGDGELFDQDGVRHRFFSDLLHNHVVLINVVYTECRDACPLITRLLGQVKDRLGDEFGRTVLFLSLSSDPLRDTPESLKTFARKHQADHPGWRFLSAGQDVLKPLLSRLGQWPEKPADHQSLLIAGNASRAHWVKIRPDATPDFIYAELQRVAAKP
ncbi:MAG: SCO family protein [Nitrospira sp.]|nr:SCO family protein [Nitrospira sp.]